MRVGNWGRRVCVGRRPVQLPRHLASKSDMKLPVTNTIRGAAPRELRCTSVICVGRRPVQLLRQTYTHDRLVSIRKRHMKSQLACTLNGLHSIFARNPSHAARGQTLYQRESGNDSMSLRGENHILGLEWDATTFPNPKGEPIKPGFWDVSGPPKMWTSSCRKGFGAFGRTKVCGSAIGSVQGLRWPEAGTTAVAQLTRVLFL